MPWVESLIVCKAARVLDEGYSGGDAFYVTDNAFEIVCLTSRDSRVTSHRVARINRLYVEQRPTGWRWSETMKTRLWTLALALAFVGCSAEDEAADPQDAVVRAEDAGAGAEGAADAAPDATRGSDVGTPDAAVAGEPDAEVSDEPDAEVAGEPDAGGFACDGVPGVNVGDAAPDFEVYDCEGNPWRPMDACGAPLWIFEFAAWCPPCRRFLGEMEGLYGEFADTDLQAVVIISQTSSFGPPDEAFCASVRREYGLEIPVLFDPQGALRQALDVPANDINVLLDASGQIAFKRQYAGVDAVRAALSDLTED